MAGNSTDNRDTLIRMVDDAYSEFDRLMLKALEEIRAHAALEADYHELVARHNAARDEACAFVVETAMAFKDLRQQAAA